MTEHTPGPWEAIDGKRGYQIHAGHHWIANLKCESCPAHEEANARLIAEAPRLKAENERLTALNAELLEAARRSLQYVILAAHDARTDDRLDDITKQMPIDDAEIIRAAIKKATS